MHVVVVSTSRTPETDRSGPALVAALEAAGHSATAREIVPDDAGQIRSKLESVLTGPTRAVIFAGGTGISLRDGTFEAIDQALDKRLPGFGELFRALSYQEIGSAAMLSRATAGVIGDTVVFAIPGSPAACRLAVEALIAPELGHLLRELDKEKPPQEQTVAEGARVSSAAVLLEEPMPELPPAALPSGWMLQLWQLGGRIHRERDLTLNPALAAVAAAANVLSTAGERAVVELDSADYLAFGFPDLQRPSSRVLLVGTGGPFGEILALHRWPTKTGILQDEAGGALGPSGRLGRLSIEITGKDYPESGRVLARDGGAVWVIEGGGRVFRWDGRVRREEGPAPGVLASLLLQWSQR